MVHDIGRAKCYIRKLKNYTAASRLGRQKKFSLFEEKKVREVNCTGTAI